MVIFEIFPMFGDEIIIQTDGNGKKKDKFIKKQKIGSGGFAKCYMLVNCRTKEKFAAKVIDSKEIHDKSSQNKILQEIQIHKEMRHDNIVRFYDMFVFEGAIYIIMELCQNNSMKEFIKSRVRITEFEAKCYLHQIIDALQYIHSKNIVHRDIKLGNIFLNFKMEVKVGDFGLSTKLRTPKQRKYTTCGTPNYIAPEILKETGHSYEADIWAIGIILFAMLTGRPPFESESVENTYKKIKTGVYEFPPQIPISSEAKSLIRGILDPNPKSRFTLKQIRNSEFLSKQLHKIPQLMPAYTISIPPQSKYLKQYISQKNMKLQILPKKIAESRVTQLHNAESVEEKEKKNQKLSRVLSADKNLLRKITQDISTNRKQISSLNRGRYIKALRIKSLSKDFKSINLNSERNEKANIRTQQINVAFSALSCKYEEDTTQIICYYDMSQKYGIGYLLSNGNFGVVFNDHTCLSKLMSEEPSSVIKEEKMQNEKYIYFMNGHVEIHRSIPNQLEKKSQILKICEKKLSNFRHNNIPIPYYSEVYAKKWVKLKNCFAIKMSNSIIQFFWDSDSVALRGYKWIKWRVNEEEGQGALNQKNLPERIEEKIKEVKNFLIRESSKKRKDKG